MVAVFLDVEGAFDKVWVNGLLSKIFRMGLPNFLICIITGFLLKCSLRVKVGDHYSNYVQMKAGTPQGAVLSPVLFNIFVDDIASIIKDSNVQLAQYADDIALWVADDCPQKAEAAMNECLEKLSSWTTNGGLNWHRRNPLSSSLQGVQRIGR